MSAAPAYVTHADLGGRKGLGDVSPEANEPLFHARWESRALALTLAMGATGSWTIDQSRAAREQQPGYLSMSYYEIWIGGLERLMADRGLITAADLAAGHAVDPPKPVARVLTAANVPAVLARGGPTERPATTPASFAVGDRVRTARIDGTRGHTRLPAYAQGQVGTITHCHGVHVFADANATAAGEAPEWLYTVRFSGVDLFGADGDPTVSVSVDAWESYLSAA